MATLQRIGIGSAFKVGVVVYGLMFLIFGAIGLACNLTLLAPLMASGVMVNGEMTRASDLMGGFGALGLGALCFGYLVGIVASALTGGISLALMAVFYNWAVRWVGGLEVELAGTGTMPASVILGDMRSGMR